LTCITIPRTVCMVCINAHALIARATVDLCIASYKRWFTRCLIFYCFDAFLWSRIFWYKFTQSGCKWLIYNFVINLNIFLNNLLNASYCVISVNAWGDNWMEKIWNVCSRLCFQFVCITPHHMHICYCLAPPTPQMLSLNYYIALVWVCYINKSVCSNFFFSYFYTFFDQTINKNCSRSLMHSMS